MKIAHIGDVHYAPKTLDEVDRCFAFAVEQAISEECQVAVIPGDLFDHRVDVHSPAVSRLMQRVARLADAMPVLILQGTYSHDVPGSLDVFKTMGGKFPVFVADRICQVGLYITEDKSAARFEPSQDWLFDDYQSDYRFGSGGANEYRVLFSCLPAINKGAVAAAVGAEKASESVGDYVYELLKGWAPVNLTARAAGIPTVLMSHGTVSGSINEQGVPMAGLDHEFTTGALLAAETAAVMLNHIHQHQEWHDGNGRAIAYAGSVGRLHFGEVKQKGFLIWDVQPDRALPRFIVTPAKKLLQIDFPGVPDMDELASIAKDSQGAHVRVRWVVDEEFRHSIDKEAIRALFASASEVKLEGRVNPIVRTRSEGITRMSLAEKLQKWAEVTATDATPLIERLSVLQHKEPDQIVQSILGETAKEKVKAA